MYLSRTGREKYEAKEANCGRVRSRKSKRGMIGIADAATHARTGRNERRDREGFKVALTASAANVGLAGPGKIAVLSGSDYAGLIPPALNRFECDATEYTRSTAPFLDTSSGVKGKNKEDEREVTCPFVDASFPNQTRHVTGAKDVFVR